MLKFEFLGLRQILCMIFLEKCFLWYVLHVFFLSENFLEENEPQKPQNLKKMLRKSRASNG